jgi:hypothetical protein
MQTRWVRWQTLNNLSLTENVCRLNTQEILYSYVWQSHVKVGTLHLKTQHNCFLSSSNQLTAHYHANIIPPHKCCSKYWWETAELTKQSSAWYKNKDKFYWNNLMDLRHYHKLQNVYFTNTANTSTYRMSHHINGQTLREYSTGHFKQKSPTNIKFITTNESSASVM